MTTQPLITIGQVETIFRYPVKSMAGEQDLAAGAGRRHGASVQVMHLKHGIFDEASISVMIDATVSEIGYRRFGSN